MVGKVTPVVTVLLALVAGTLGVLSPAGVAEAALLHDYDLNGTYADRLGGPPLVPNGGTLGPAGYTFAAGQGLSLSNALRASGDYSIEMGLTLDSTDGYRKLLDFKDLTSDNGLYDYYTSLYFYDLDQGPDGAFAAGVPATVLLTRNGNTGEVVGYVNGVEQIRFIDAAGDATFSAANNIINFLQDDTVTGGEDPSGFLDFVRISDGPTAQTRAPALGVPGLFAMALFFLGLGARNLARRRSAA